MVGLYPFGHLIHPKVGSKNYKMVWKFFLFLPMLQYKAGNHKEQQLFLPHEGHSPVKDVVSKRKLQWQNVATNACV